MLGNNIYNTIFDWVKVQLEYSFKENNIDIDLFREIMPLDKTQGVVIKKESSGDVLETYISGESLISCKMSVNFVQKLNSYTENEVVSIMSALDKSIYDILKNFEYGDKPELETGYSIKNFELENSEGLSTLDINTVVYSIGVIFQIKTI